MADQVLTRDGPVAVPMDYAVPQGGELIPLVVNATLDGSAAASAFYGAVQVIAPSGRVMGTAITSSIAAGASAAATWFPGMTATPDVVTTVATLATVALFQTGQSIPNNAYTTIAFDSVLSAHDPDGVFQIDLTTGIVTTTKQGVFLIDTFLGFAGSASGNLRLLMNGTAGTFGKSEDSFASNSDLSCSGALNSQAGQTFSSLIYQNSGGPLPIFRARTTLAMLAPTP